MSVLLDTYAIICLAHAIYFNLSGWHCLFYKTCRKTIKRCHFDMYYTPYIHTSAVRLVLNMDNYCFKTSMMYKFLTILLSLKLPLFKNSIYIITLIFWNIVKISIYGVTVVSTKNSSRKRATINHRITLNTGKREYHRLNLYRPRYHYDKTNVNVINRKLKWTELALFQMKLNVYYNL